MGSIREQGVVDLEVEICAQTVVGPGYCELMEQPFANFLCLRFVIAHLLRLEVY